MAKQVVIKLTDDIDGSDATESLTFAIDGNSYEIDLNANNAASLRQLLAPYVEKARGIAAGRQRSHSRQPSNRTLFSLLGVEDQKRFRIWADMPNARRIRDGRVQEWIDAGRP